MLRIYNSEGEEVGFHDDVDYAAGKVNSVLAFSPDAGGVYFISAGAYTGNPTQDNSGRYQVAVYEAETSLMLTGTSDWDYFPHNSLKGSPGDDELDGKGGWDWLEGGRRRRHPHWRHRAMIWPHTSIPMPALKCAWTTGRPGAVMRKAIRFPAGRLSNMCNGVKKRWVAEVPEFEEYYYFNYLRAG